VECLHNCKDEGKMVCKKCEGTVSVFDAPEIKDRPAGWEAAFRPSSSPPQSLAACPPPAAAVSLVWLVGKVHERSLPLCALPRTVTPSHTLHSSASLTPLALLSSDPLFFQWGKGQRSFLPKGPRELRR
jgi:hypothetical protein